MRANKSEKLRRRTSKSESSNLNFVRLEQRTLLSADGVIVTPDSIITHHDVIPRFVANPTDIAIQDGNWSNPNTWADGSVPTRDDLVRIPDGVSVEFDMLTEVDSLEVAGHLEFATDVDTSILVTTITVLPNGVFTVGTFDKPVSDGVEAEIVFRDIPLQTGTIDEPGIDPFQFGNGLLSFGSTIMHGRTLDDPFLELGYDADAGDEIIYLRDEPTGWRAGDELVFPDTRKISPVDVPGVYDYQGQYETVHIESIDGRAIKLESPLKFAHRGPENADGSATIGFDGNRVMPHVGNLTRNITIRSENPDGVRGHTSFFANSIHDVRYVTLHELGRTVVGEIDNTVFENGELTHIGSNQVGRYSHHLHHLSGPAGGIAISPGEANYQWVGIGNSIVGALKWGTAIHDSHYGLLKNNVYYDADGSAIATESGSEYENLIDSNFVVRVNGGGGDFAWHGVQRTEGQVDRGDMGDGIWLAGPMNSVRNNVVANAIRDAYIVYTDNVPSEGRSTYRPVRVPLYPGANMHHQHNTRVVNVISEPFDDFVGNEAYGATTAAVWLWSVGDRTNFPDATGRNTLTDTTVWHISGSGVYFYYANDHLVDGWLQRGDPAAIGLSIRNGGSSKPSTGITHGGAIAATTDIRRADIQGVEIGFRNRGRGISDELSISDSFLDNATNIVSETWSQTPLDGSRDLQIKDVVFGDKLYPGASQNLDFDVRLSLPEQVIVPETTIVKNYNGWVGVDLEVFYLEQAPNFVLPSNIDSPAAGLTNAEAFARYGVAIAGRVAPTQQYDNDNGESAWIRGKAAGIDGLIFLTDEASTLPPRLLFNFANESGKNILYYAILGDESQVRSVRFSVGGATIDSTENAGRIVLEDLPTDANIQVEGIINFESGSDTSYRELRLPIRPAPTGESNNRPELKLPEDQRVIANQELVFWVSADDVDDESLELSAANLPEGSVFDESTGRFTWVPDNNDTGDHSIQFVATDARGKQDREELKITVVYDSSDSPVLGSWSMNDQGSIAVDASPNHNDGQILGAVPHPQGGLWFNGLENEVRISSSPILRPESSFTTEMWVSPEGRSDFRDLIRYNAGSAAAYALEVKDAGASSTQGYHFGVTTELGRTVIHAPKSTWDGSWDYLVAVFDSEVEGGAVSVFVNGELVTRKTGVGTRIVYKPFGSQDITVGFSDRKGVGFEGGISDVRFTSSAIEASEISARFYAGRGSAKAGSAGYWSASSLDSTLDIVSANVSPNAGGLQNDEPDFDIAIWPDRFFPETEHSTSDLLLNYGSSAHAENEARRFSLDTFFIDFQIDDFGGNQFELS